MQVFKCISNPQFPRLTINNNSFGLLGSAICVNAKEMQRCDYVADDYFISQPSAFVQISSNVIWLWIFSKQGIGYSKTIWHTSQRTAHLSINTDAFSSCIKTKGAQGTHQQKEMMTPVKYETLICLSFCECFLTTFHFSLLVCQLVSPSLPVRGDEECIHQQTARIPQTYHFNHVALLHQHKDIFSCVELKTTK